MKSEKLIELRNDEECAALQHSNTIERETTISHEELEEAFQWHKLFNEGWITAHELSNLSKNSSFEIEEQLFKVETKKLQKIKTLLDYNLTDDEFVNKLDKLNELLPRPFQEMRGMGQHQPHGEYDPTEHTLRALKLLKTEGFSKEAVVIARAALIFHDVGKVKDPLSRLHAYRSENMAREYLQKMGFSSEEIQNKILMQIRCHDMLGEATRIDGENIFNERDLLLIFDNQQDLDIHHAVTLADIEAIDGLSWVLADIEQTYNRVSRKMSRREQYLKDASIFLPFERVEYATLFELREKLFDENVDFDSINSKQEELYRRIKFEGGIFKGALFNDDVEITEEFEGVGNKREIMEKILIQSALEYDRKLLFALKLMGRDTDIQYAHKLEKKYNIELANLKIAMYINKMTYNLWEIRFDVEKVGELIDSDVEHIKKKLNDIKDIAEKLAKYEIKATHVTSTSSVTQIKKDKYLKASNSTLGNHFEGDGVYMGLFNSYKDWNSGGIFECTISLADTLPMRVSYQDPKFMVVVFSEYLDIFETKNLGVPSGLRHWRQDVSDHNTADWKVALIGELLNADTIVIKDDENKPCIIADTNADPIVWGALSRALKIRRFIPKSELKKIGLGDNIIETTFVRKQEDVLDYYKKLINQTIKIRGVDRKNIVNEI